MRSQRAKEMRNSRLDSDYESGSDGDGGRRGGGSASNEGGGEVGADDGQSAEDTEADEGWQQVRDGAAALQQETSSAVVLQRAIFAQQAQLSEGRYEVLRLDTGDEDEEMPEGAGAEVDTPGFRFDRRECRLVGQREGWEKEAKEQGRVDEVLASYYSSEKGVESQRQAAEWAAGGWQQPVGWGSCLD